MDWLADFIGSKNHRKICKTIIGVSSKNISPAVELVTGAKFWYINGKYFDSIPVWTKALFDYKGWTPEFLASKGKDYDKLVDIYAQKMISDYQEQ